MTRVHPGILALALIVMPTLVGCHAIRSPAVRSLIDREGDKIAMAQKSADTFIKATKERNEAMMKAVQDFDASTAAAGEAEAIVALVFAANRDVVGRTGSDAEALGLMAARAYLASNSRLPEARRRQFDDNAKALEELAKQLAASWNGIAEQHEQIAAYSKKSAAASVDPAALGALLGQSEEALRYAAKVQDNGEKLAEALEKIDDADVADPIPGEAGRYLNDLLRLLEQAGGNAGQGS